MNVLLKTVERCNVNCDYCYFFNGIDDSFARHPAVISRNTIDAVVSFLRQGVNDLGLTSLSVVFHGGEPMLQRKNDFDWMCRRFRDALEPHVRTFRLGIQTNGTLVDPEWIEILGRHKIGVGVSVDGPKAVHDAHRVDHRGRGTYDRVVAGLRMLQQAAADRTLPYSVGAIAVVDVTQQARVVFDHLVDELGLRIIHCELPDNTVDMPGVHLAPAYGRYLCEMFDAWADRDDPSIHVRLIASLFAKLGGRSSYLFARGADVREATSHIGEISIASNGELGPDDALRQTHFWRELPKADVRSMSLAAYLDEPRIKELRDARVRAPVLCNGCLWEHVCGGGAIVNRWSATRGFDNPSAYCSGLKDFYGHVISYLVSHGVSMHALYGALDPDAHHRTGTPAHKEYQLAN